MDVHRCRFVPYPPSTINAIAFSHSHISKDQETAPPRLAVGRANGDIELWNPLRGSWLQETIIRGGKDRSIDGLVWTQDPNEDVEGVTIIGRSRLFSIGYTTTVTEWDLERGQPLRSASGNHGEIWCIAAQPTLAPAPGQRDGAVHSQWSGQKLITGCTDGALVLYTTEGEDLQLQKVLVRPSSKKAKIISVVFQNRNVVVAGCSDSIIRIYDIRSGALLRNMTMGSGPRGGPKEILVWTVKVLKDGTIISGDSTGEVKIWDGKTYTLRQRIKSHRQDVLSLSTSADGSSIFSGGMDRRTVIYKPVGTAKTRWAEVSHRRFHTHDVKTMATFEGCGISVVVSGGPDASLTVLPLSKFGFENSRALSHIPQEIILRSASKQRLMMSWWEREVHIWRLIKPASPQLNDEHSEGEPASVGRKIVARILIKGEANITSATLSEDGGLLVVATSVDVKAFQLRARGSEESGLKINKVHVPAAIASGARLVQLSPDSKWLSIIRLDSQISLARILGNSSSSPDITIHTQACRLSRIDRKANKLTQLGGLGAYGRTVMQSVFSSNSRILAVSDIAGYVDTFILSGQEDLIQTPTDAEDAPSDLEDLNSDSESEEPLARTTRLIFGQHWARNPLASSVPRLPAAPVVLSFRPDCNSVPKPLTDGTTIYATRNNPNPIPHDLPVGEDRLLIVTATSDIYEFEVLRGGLSQWSRRNPTSSFPPVFRKTIEQVRGCIWDVSAGKQRVWLYSVSSLFMFDVSRDFPSYLDDEDVNGEVVEGSKKRKRRDHTSGAGGAIPDAKLGTGISRKMKRFVEDEVDVEETIMNGADADAMELDDDDDETTTLALRRGSVPGVSREVTGGPHHWHTFKYRPILGVVVIGEADNDDGPEVAVVERPIWECDLPPRYYGEQEWREEDLVGL